MFYKLIQKKRDLWLASEACPVRELLSYVVSKAKLRDAQIEAVKTYLFLKIACQCRSLYDLFVSGEFNSDIEWDKLELTTTSREYLQNNPAAAALYEYASMPDDSGKPFSPKVLAKIKSAPTEIDYNAFFKKAFYDVSYSDYLFSLPMGAGKTYLMAAFIYLDLYFAENEPENPAFAHNFIILAPSGLKSSVIPSLRTIQNFDPSWVIPEPAASNLRRKLIFEVLDQNKSASKSNKTKNPNVQKIAIHQPLQDLFGLVAVTNAEKVILDRVDVDEKTGQLQLIEKTDDETDRQANELRNLIGKLPHLSVFIDEVHHAATDDKKLRAVVNKWMKNHTLNSVIGFSGTPYLAKTEKLSVAPGLSVASIEISNIVYYYPLVNGIGNFLKKPTVKIVKNLSRIQIVEQGIRDFFASYKDTVYPDGTCAKLGIYCGLIETLETEIYPLAVKLAEEYGFNALEVILRYHGGNKFYPKPTDSDLEFASLDKPFSKIRIILLAQIGKEGWDCRSLTGIILSQEGDCPTNMVLQTSCRCLRQVQKNVTETALICLNGSNAEALNKQLEQLHHISISEFEKGASATIVELKRFDRTEYLQLPPVNFYQLRVEHQEVVVDEGRNTVQELSSAADNTKHYGSITSAEMKDRLVDTDIATQVTGSDQTVANYNSWLYSIAKGSFGQIAEFMALLLPYDAILRQLFEKITVKENDIVYFSPEYRIDLINANIRKAFYAKRTFKSSEALISEDARLLKVGSFTSTVHTPTPENFYPDQSAVQRIIDADAGKGLSEEQQKTIAMLESIGQKAMADKLRNEIDVPPHKDQSYHYLPYRTDSTFEQKFLQEVLLLDCVNNLNLEVYYNGDRALTEFKICCYKKVKSFWKYIGMYTPDFLIVQRKDGDIHRAIIVETKGRIYANDPTFQDKKAFVENTFLQKNNEVFQYARFDYLYLEDSDSEQERINKTATAIKDFFEEANNE